MCCKFLFLFGVLSLSFLSSVSAAPSSSSSSLSALSSTSSSFTLPASSHRFLASTSHRPFITNRPHSVPTGGHHQSVEIISRPTLPTPHSRPITHPRPTGIFHTPTPANSNQSTIAIVFEVLGGLVGLAILYSFFRCCNNYRNTPRRDRIADVLQRHQLQRELEEIERNPAILRRPSLREPAPPYFPRPPSYDDLAPSLMRTAPPRTEYAPLVTYSPPPSPPMSQRPLPSSEPTAHRPAEFTPSLPSG